jgi:hypothetical protein
MENGEKMNNHQIANLERRFTETEMFFRATCSCGARSDWKPTRPAAVRTLATHHADFTATTAPADAEPVVFPTIIRHRTRSAPASDPRGSDRNLSDWLFVPMLLTFIWVMLALAQAAGR